MKIHSSCEVEDFVETHLCKLCVILRSRVLRVVCPVKIRPRKACNYPNLRSFGWVSYDKVGVLFSEKLGNRSEARASDL